MTGDGTVRVSPGAAVFFLLLILAFSFAAYRVGHRNGADDEKVRAAIEESKRFDAASAVPDERPR